MILGRPLGVRFLGGIIDATEVYGHFGAKDILLDGVAFENINGRMLNLVNNSTASMFGATNRNGRTTWPSSSVVVAGASSLSLSAPAGYPGAVPPSNGEDAVAPDAPTGFAATARDAQIWLG